MLRRNLREAYRGSQPSQEQKDAMLRDILNQAPDKDTVKGKKWKPKGQLGCWLIIAALVLALGVGVGYLASLAGLTDYVAQQLQQFRQQQTEPSESTEPSEETEPSTETTIPEDPYSGIPQLYITAIQEGWDPDRCAGNDISVMVSYLQEPAQLQYALMDLDGDGVKELLITDGKVIYDLYAWRGEVLHVFSGWERNSYTLTLDNVIVNVGSNGAASTIYNFYRYSNGYLITDQQIIFDAEKDPEAPWFRGFGDPDVVDPISEEEANRIINSMSGAPIIGKPITEYTP